MSKREEIIRLVLSKDEKASIVKAATAAGVQTAVWARMQILRAAKADE